jgi:hypothetical protein
MTAVLFAFGSTAGCVCVLAVATSARKGVSLLRLLRDWLHKQFHEELMPHRITRNFLRFVEIPDGRHLRRELRLVLRLSPHLLGVFLLGEAEAFGERGCQRFKGIQLRPLHPSAVAAYRVNPVE